MTASLFLSGASYPQSPSPLATERGWAGQLFPRESFLQGRERSQLESRHREDIAKDALDISSTYDATGFSEERKLWQAAPVKEILRGARSRPQEAAIVMSPCRARNVDITMPV